jgi:FkbM family methyltransferase
MTAGLRLARIKAARTTGRPLPVVASTFWGDKMRVVLPESLSCELYGYHYFEEGLSAFMLNYVRSGQRVFDVGAHYGYFSRLSSTLVGPSGSVHCFEPTPRTYALLVENTADLCNVTCNAAAVWHCADTVQLTDFGANMSMFNSLMAPRIVEDGAPPVGAQFSVPAVSLDDYADSVGRPDFVKIDAESAEWHVLEGMAGLLRDAKPIVTLEVGDFDVDGAATSRALLDHVIGHGYAAYEYVNGEIRAHTLQDSYRYDNIFLLEA